jgi:hypothetical protein
METARRCSTGSWLGVIEACVPAHAITTLHYLVSKYQSKNAASTLIIRHPMNLGVGPWN